MFVALNAKSRARVTSIASEWDSAEEALRELAAVGELVCPGCEQSLWVKARSEQDNVTARPRRRLYK